MNYTSVQSQIEEKEYNASHIPLLEKDPKLGKTVLKVLSWINNNQERISTNLYFKQLLKAFNVRTKTILNQLKQIQST